MSGPKASDYTLEAQRREALRRAQEEERKRREALLRAQEEERKRKETIRRNAEAIRLALSEAETAACKAREIMNEQAVRMVGMGMQTDAGHLTQMDQALNKLKQTYSKPEQVAESTGSSAVTQCRVACSSIISLANAISRQVGQMEAQIQEKTASAVQDELERMKRRKESEQRALRKEKEKKQWESEQRVNAVAAEIRGKLDELSVMLPDEETEELNLIRESFTFILTEQSNMPEQQLEQLHTLLQVAVTRLEKQTIRLREIEELQCQYVALCQMLDWPIGTLTRDKAELTALCEHAAAELENRAIRQQVEQALQECMQEMGYTLLGKRNTDDVDDMADYGCSDMLYHMHGQTVVHITHSGTGQIAMEIGLGEDRQRDMQDSEVDELVRDMADFCGNYDELQRRLREKGVVVRQDIMRCPPAREFAHTIDLTEFNVDANQMRQAEAESSQAAGVLYRTINTEGGLSS